MHIAHRWPLTKGVVAKITFKMGKYLNVPPQEWALVDTIDVYGGVDFSLVNAEIPLGERERDTHTHVDIIWFPYINAMATYCCYYFSAHKAWLWPCCLCRSFRRFGLKLHQRWDSASRERRQLIYFWDPTDFVLNTCQTCQVRDKRTYSSWWVWLILCFTLFSTAAWKWLKKANILAVPSSWGWTALRLHAVGIPWIISSRAFPGLGSVVSRASRILKHCIVICHM